MVKSGYGDFTAYYNTFYNAKKYYASGFKDIEKSQEKINPERFVNVIEDASRAGDRDFALAIEKGAKILRDHNESRWVSDALLLIGKSYFYQTKYFSASQKFDELYNTSKKANLTQQAIYWKGLTLNKMSRMSEAVDIIQLELNTSDNNWQPEHRAMAFTVLAEAHVALENYDLARDVITMAIPDLKKSSHIARAWFLKGQLEEKLKLWEDALISYRNVARENPIYELVYFSNLKCAQIARENNKLDEALTIFQKMASDDKNFDVITELEYEIARTYQLMRKYELAIQRYKSMLYNSFKKPSNETYAKSYYALAEIAIKYKNDLSLASAYFDSSASKAKNSNRLPEEFDAIGKAVAYGKYASLNKKVHLSDSLLYLSTLNPAQLDSVIAILKKKKEEEIKKLREKQKEQSQTMITGSSGNNSEAATEELNSKNGFLNHKNPVMLTQMREDFNAYWGNRPLVDNWRRRDAVRSYSSNTVASDKNGKKKVEVIQVRIDLSAIPTDSASKSKMIKDLSNALYEIGNVFFLTLNQPDSARVYYKKILNNYSEQPIALQALYSLSELEYSQGHTIDASQLARRLVEMDSKNRFAHKIIEKYNWVEYAQVNDTVSPKSSNGYETYLEIKNDERDNNRINKAEKLRHFALNLSDAENELKGLSLLSAVHLYIESAKEEPEFTENYLSWLTHSQNVEIEKKELASLKDSAKVILADTTLTPDLRAYWQSIRDSSKTDISHTFFPYSGAKWDSVRVILTQITTRLNKFSDKKKALLLLDEFKIPKELIPSNDSKATDKAKDKKQSKPKSDNAKKSESGEESREEN